jgi:hypothetical protein
MTKNRDTIEFEQHVQKLHDIGHMTQLLWSPTIAITIIAELQLALRHPSNKGESATIARQVVDSLIAGLDIASPGIGALLRRGDDPAHDVAQPKDGAK